MDLVEKLNAASKKVRSNRKYANNEDNTRAYLVEPFIKALGFEPNEPQDVEQQVASDAGPADIALKIENKKIAVIEIKKEGTDLSRHTLQLKKYYYNVEKSIRFGILTNGVEYHLYCDLVEAKYMDDEPFLTIDVLKLNEKQIQELCSFTKNEFDENQAVTWARRLKYMFALRSVLESEFRSPSEELIGLFIKRIRPELKSVTKKVRVEMSPIVTEVWHEFVSSGQSGGSSPPQPPANGDVVQVPINGYFKKGEWAGHRFEATLLLYKRIADVKIRILFQGDELTPTGAAQRAFEKKLGKKPSVNGFWFWKVTDQLTGLERPILDVRSDDEFRYRLLRGK